MKYDYLNAVEQRLKKENSKKTILAELEAHIDDKLEYYLELGYSKEEAEKRAVEEMGEPDDAALPLRALHSKAKTTVLMIVTIVYVVLVLIAEYSIKAMQYSNGLAYHTDNRAGNPHNIWMDFLSFAIVSGFVILLILAYKKKSISVPVIIFISLLLMLGGEFLLYRLIDILQAIFPKSYEGMGYMLAETSLRDKLLEFVPCAVFQPFLYAVFKIFTSGISGYTESILSPGFPDAQFKELCKTGAVVICFVLMAIALFQLVLVRMQTLLKRTKTGNRIISVLFRVVCVFLALYFMFMTACSVAALINRKDSKVSSKSEKLSVLSDVIYTLPNEMTDEYLKSHGYKEHVAGENDALDAYFRTERYYYKGNTDNLIALQNWSEYYVVTFKSADGGGLLTDEEYDLIFGSDKINTLGDLLDYGFYDKAVSVEHSQSTTTYGENVPTDGVIFTFNCSGNRQVECFFNAEYKTLESRPDIREYEMIVYPFLDFDDYTNY